MKYTLSSFLFLFLISLKLVAQGPYDTPVYKVLNTNDSGSGSLRQCILDYKTINPGYILFQIPGNSNPTIYLQTPLPPFSSPSYAFQNNSVMNVNIVAATQSAAQSDGITEYASSFGNPNTTYTGLSGVSLSFTYQFFTPKSFVVTNTSSSGVGSINHAILEADARAVTSYDSIVFNIPGPAPHIISQSITLKTGIILDATTQPANGYSGNAPKIELVGDGSPIHDGITVYGPSQYEAYGLTYANGSEIYGFYIHKFNRGIAYNNSSNLIIGKSGKGNVLSGNYYGVTATIDIGGSNIIIQNNIIGLNPMGVAEPNLYGGIGLIGKFFTILNNTISGNSVGIVLGSVLGTNDFCESVVIKGNKIGVSSNGSQMIPNSSGIYLKNCANVTIGGPGNERNIISGNTGNGVWLNGLHPGNITITNNYIGTDITGTLDFGNGGYGIQVGGSSGFVSTIGGLNSSDGNLIAYNGIGASGVFGNQIRNNSFFGNDIGIEDGSLDAPIITNRSYTSIEGTAIAGSLVQIFEDDRSSVPQGKTFIAEVNTDVNGNWSYTASIQNPCRITAICIQFQSNYPRSSGFSIGFGEHPDLTPDTLIFCNGTSAVIKAADGFSNYVWNTGFSGQTLTTTTPGKYWVNVNNGCLFSDTVIVMFTNPPVVALGEDTSICGNIPLTMNISEPGIAFYSWYKQSSTDTYTKVSSSSIYSITQSGSYAVKLSKGECSNMDTVNVIFYPLPKAILGNDTIVCGPMILSAQQNFSGALYTWSTGASSTSSIPVTVPGSYSLEIKYTETCFSRDTVNVVLTNCNAVQGMIFLDKNNNSTYQASDSLVQGLLVEAKTADLTYYAVTQNDGTYHFALPSGTYTIKVGTAQTNVVAPSSKYYTINVGELPTQLSYDFVLIPALNDLSISMTSPVNIRLGTLFVSSIIVRNEGAASQRGLVTVKYDPFLIYSSCNKPLISSSSNELLFDIGDLRPGQVVVFYITWKTLFNNTLLGKIGQLTSSVNADDVAENNYALNSINYAYPYDPNHKYVTVQFDPSTQQSKDSKCLQYIVEFQNTGTDTAHKVVITDTLSKKLNPLTFQPGAASAPYTWAMGEGGVVTFTFADIYLPDSNVNQEGSRGFVSFTIDHLMTQVGDSLYNNASIFFDLAEPVRTNKVYYKMPGVQNEQNLSLSPITTLKYGQPYMMINAGATSGLPVSYAYDGPIEVRGDTLFILGVGSALLEAFQQGNNQFLSAVPKYIYFEIGKGDQSIYFEAINDKLVTDPDFNLNAYGGNSGNPILFEVLRGPAVVDGNVVTIIGSGEVEIAATQEGNALYEEASAVTRVFEVNLVTAIKDENSVRILVGPNPFMEYIIVNDEVKAQKGKFEIYNIQGILLQSASYYSGERITTMHLTKGSYILKLYKDERVVLTQTIIKQ